MTRNRRQAHSVECIRIAWRPSRWLIAGLATIGVLGAIGALSSGLPPMAAWGLAALAPIVGVVQAWREASKPARDLAFLGPDIATLDGRPLTDLDLRWRGPLAFLRARDDTGRLHRLAWWPDTLGRPDRRALRLALLTREMRG
jgi:toxin CptA